MADPSHMDKNDGGPPIFKSWTRMYAFVLGFLAVLIVVFYLFGRMFS
jgi:glucose uptake protein GlcU